MWLGLRCAIDRYSNRASWVSHSTGREPDFTDWTAGEPAESCDDSPKVHIFWQSFFMK
jgi:hypothetical protein